MGMKHIKELEKERQEWIDRYDQTYNDLELHNRISRAVEKEYHDELETIKKTIRFMNRVIAWHNDNPKSKGAYMP